VAELLTKIFLAYLLGDIMGGQVVGRLRGGVDLRAHGSGNIGATNALRTQGKGFALAVLAIDVGKGVFAAGVLPGLPWPWGGPSQFSHETLAYCCGAAAALGHCYPAFYAFRGGKGVATLAGVYATVTTAALPWILLAFIAVVIATGYVSLATLIAALVALLHVACFTNDGLFSPLGAFAGAMTLLVLWKHRENWQRLLRGSEHRFEKARVVHRWLQR
jgi:glycerol-3-phosphate acyltransferase PlsY